MLWRSSETAIRDSVRNACRVVREAGYRSLAMPIIGGGTGGFDEEKALGIILEELEEAAGELDVTVVRFRVSPAM